MPHLRQSQLSRTQWFWTRKVLVQKLSRTRRLWCFWRRIDNYFCISLWQSELKTCDPLWRFFYEPARVRELVDRRPERVSLVLALCVWSPPSLFPPCYSGTKFTPFLLIPRLFEIHFYFFFSVPTYQCPILSPYLFLFYYPYPKIPKKNNNNNNTIRITIRNYNRNTKIERSENRYRKFLTILLVTQGPHTQCIFGTNCLSKNRSIP